MGYDGTDMTTKHAYHRVALACTSYIRTYIVYVLVCHRCNGLVCHISNMTMISWLVCRVCDNMCISRNVIKRYIDMTTFLTELTINRGLSTHCCRDKIITFYPITSLNNFSCIKLSYFVWINVLCSHRFNWQASISSDNGLAPKRGQAII